MSRESRKLARVFVCCALALCGLLDAGLGEGAISGCCDVANWSNNGTWSMPQPQPELWPWIGGFTLVQGILIAALLRLRDSER